MSFRIRPFAADDKDACLALFDSNVPRYFDSSERPDFADFWTNRTEIISSLIRNRKPAAVVVLQRRIAGRRGLPGAWLIERAMVPDLAECWLNTD